MLLQRLVEYSKRKKDEDRKEGTAIPKMYNKIKIDYYIDLDKNGNFTGFVKTADGKGKGIKRPAPYLRRSGSNTKPQLLADKAEFVFGLIDEDKKRAESRKRDFLALVEACASFTHLQEVKTVLNFLTNINSLDFISDIKLTPSTVFTFRVGEVLPIDLKEVQFFWPLVVPFLSSKGISELTADIILKNINTEISTTMSEEQWQCIICSESKAPARTHPIAIKLPLSVSDQQCSIVSGNKDSFLSYGLEQSFIAPTCIDCAEDYAKSANALLQDENTHIAVGPLVYIFWTKEDTGFSFASLLSKPNPSDVQALIESAYKGKEAAAVVDETKFYASAFSASGSRVAVRDWLETTVSYVKENLARWFKFQRIVDSYTGAEGLPFPLKGYFRKDNRWASGIIDDLAPRIQKRRDMDNLSPNIPKVFLHFALKGGLLPEWLLYQAVNRNRMEQNVTRSRAAIIKMVLLSRNNINNEEGKMECLDLENRNPAYLCGRLLGVLEIVQVEAFKPSTINSTIVDRFYGTASSAPASVFGKLLRGVQPHLTKLRKEKHGTFEAMAKQLEDVQCGLTFYPKTLTLEEQGFFALGYYHQKAANRAGAIAYKQLQHDADKNKSDEKEK